MIELKQNPRNKLVTDTNTPKLSAITQMWHPNRHGSIPPISSSLETWTYNLKGYMDPCTTELERKAAEKVEMLQLFR